MTVRHDPRVRRGQRLMKATLSPAGVVTGAGLAAVGAALGIGAPWLIAAGLGAWFTSVILHLRDPRLIADLVAPDFSRDLGQLEGEHRRYMVSGLDARNRFEEAVRELDEDEDESLAAEDFAGMRVRIVGALERLFDSLLWAQRAAGFLEVVDAEQLRARLGSLPSGSPIATELEAQLREVQEVARKRNETLARSATTITGIETLAVKVGSLALDVTAPGRGDHGDDVRQMREELDGYLAGLEEIQTALETLPPQYS